MKIEVQIDFAAEHQFRVEMRQEKDESLKDRLILDSEFVRKRTLNSRRAKFPSESPNGICN